MLSHAEDARSVCRGAPALAAACALHGPGGHTARGIESLRVGKRGGRGKPAIAGAAPANKQKIMEPRRKEWAAETSASMCSSRLWHPLAPLGVQIVFYG